MKDLIVPATATIVLANLGTAALVASPAALGLGLGYAYVRVVQGKSHDECMATASSNLRDMRDTVKDGAASAKGGFLRRWTLASDRIAALKADRVAAQEAAVLAQAASIQARHARPGITVDHA